MFPTVLLERKRPFLPPFITSSAPICYFQQSGLRLMEPATSVTAALNKSRHIPSGLKTTERCLVRIKQLITPTTWIITITIKLLTQSNRVLYILLWSVNFLLSPVQSHVHIYTLFAAVLRPTAPIKPWKNTNTESTAVHKHN